MSKTSKNIGKLFIPLLALSCNATLAAPFSTTDARTLALGDTGVASAHPGAASLFNPALLSSYADDKDFSVVLPNFGFSAFIDGDARNGIEAINDENYGDRLSTTSDNLNIAINRLTASFTGTSEQEIQAEAEARLALLNSTKNEFTNTVRGFTGELGKIDESPLGIGSEVYFAVAIPGKNLGTAVYAAAKGNIETAIDIDNCDFELLDTYITTLENYNPNTNDIIDDASSLALQDTSTTAPCGSKPVISNGDLIDPDADSQLTSNISVAAILSSEVGVALSKSFHLAGLDVAFGVTPKIMKITTLFIHPSLNEFDNDEYDLSDELDNNEEDFNDFNLDFGVSTKFLDDSLNTGIVIKNLIAHDYDMVYTSTDGSEIVKRSVSLEPQIRAGAALQKWGFTLAADLDITENDGIFEGNESRYLGLGAEYNALNILQFRLGMRSNLSNSDDAAFTAGLGISAAVVHFDLAAQVSENNLGVGMQFSMEF